MNYRLLGQTGLIVSELCLGALPMGPRQKNLDEDTCTRIIKRALLGGINFIDTAQMYGTYGPIRRAVREYGREVVIATKSTASTYKDMKQAIEQARRELDMDYIHIFHLHAARATKHVFKERAGALDCLLEAREKGFIKAVGIATHSVEAVEKSATMDDIDVVFPLINFKGLGIIGGGPAEMKKAISEVVLAGKGVYLMKVLAGGNLLKDYAEAIDFARRIPGITSIAIGMVSQVEVDYNLKYFSGEKLGEITSSQKRYSIIDALCNGDGACIEACTNGAITIIAGKARINQDKCLLCGYCTEVCPQLAIRFI